MFCFASTMEGIQSFVFKICVYVVLFGMSSRSNTVGFEFQEAVKTKYNFVPFEGTRLWHLTQQPIQPRKTFF